MQTNRSCIGLGLAILAGCVSEPSIPPQSTMERKALMDTVGIEHIEIVAALTQPKSFDEDPLPDGIEVVVRSTDVMREPTKMAGELVFELYAHRPAAADPKGRQLRTWRFALASAEDQHTYWSKVSQMYAFPLHIEELSQLPEAIVESTTEDPAARMDPDLTASTSIIPYLARDAKYVLVGRYTDPWGEHFESQAEIDLGGLVSRLRAQRELGEPISTN